MPYHILYKSELNEKLLYYMKIFKLKRKQYVFEYVQGVAKRYTSVTT